MSSYLIISCIFHKLFSSERCMKIIFADVDPQHFHEIKSFNVTPDGVPIAPFVCLSVCVCMCTDRCACVYVRLNIPVVC